MIVPHILRRGTWFFTSFFTGPQFPTHRLARQPAVPRRRTKMSTSIGVPVPVITSTTVAAESPNFFWTGRWKHARAVAIIDLILEVILFLLSAIAGWPFGLIWTLLALIGSSITAGACCCRHNKGKGIATAQIVLVSISFIGSFVSIGVLATATSYCNTYDHYAFATQSVCDYIKALLSFEILCFATRVSMVFLSARLSCCRPADWNLVGVQVAAPMQTYIPTAPMQPPPSVVYHPK